MAIFDKPPRYRSYLLTFWEERSEDPAVTAVWRFRLEDPRTGQRRVFADPEALIAALEQEGSESMERSAFEHPLNLVATPRSRTPVFLTSVCSLTPDRKDVKFVTMAWDQAGAPAPSAGFDWRCRWVRRSVPRRERRHMDGAGSMAG